MSQFFSGICLLHWIHLYCRRIVEHHCLFAPLQKHTMRKFNHLYNHRHWTSQTIDDNLPHLVSRCTRVRHTYMHAQNKQTKILNSASLLHHHKHSITFHVLHFAVHVISFVGLSLLLFVFFFANGDTTTWGAPLWSANTGDLIVIYVFISTNYIFFYKLHIFFCKRLKWMFVALIFRCE